jgi:cobalt-zinc-cadmium resistance protein CzcA
VTGTGFSILDRNYSGNNLQIVQEPFPDPAQHSVRVDRWDLALYITQFPLSVSAAVGFIALLGQAVLNGAVMVAYFDQLRQTGIYAAEAIIRGSLIRMSTVLMTGLPTIRGLLPMAISAMIGSETQKHLAIVVIGGLVSATLLTLIVLPNA